MNEHKTISIVVPTFNESARIKNTIKQIDTFCNSYFKDYEILVIDDGSTDKTYKISRRLEKVYPKLGTHKLPHAGKSHALIYGIKNCKMPYILLTDADLSVSIDQSANLYEKMIKNNCDICIGSREGEGAVRLGEPKSRKFMGRVFNFIVRTLLIEGIVDTQCGFKLLQKESALVILDRLKNYGEITETKYAKVGALDVEILFLAKKLKMKVESIPVVWEYGEGSKVSSVRDSLNNLKEVLMVKKNSLLGKYSTKEDSTNFLDITKRNTIYS